MFERAAPRSLPPTKQASLWWKKAPAALCHRITRLEDAGGNSAFTVNPKTARAMFEDAAGSLQHWLAERQINARPTMHKASYQKDFYRDAAPASRATTSLPRYRRQHRQHLGRVENSASPRRRIPAKRRTCIDCHMNPEPGNGGAPVAGQSTENGTVKERLYRHNFTGAQHQLVGLRCNRAGESLALLRSSATLSARIEQGPLARSWWCGRQYRRRPRPAHRGRRFPRTLVELTVTDASGKLVLVSGQPVDGAVPDDARLFRKCSAMPRASRWGFWRYAKL